MGAELKGMINAYQCNVCKKQTITVLIDDGTTPFIIGCKATLKCKGFAESAFYRVPQNLTPDYEWFRPKDLNKCSSEEIQHVENGGLLLRPTQKTKSELRKLLSKLLTIGLKR